VPEVLRRALTLALIASSLARAGDFQGHARLWVGPGFDSNAKREFVSTGNATTPDAFFFGLGQLDASLFLGDFFHAGGTYDVAARKFITQPSEDTIVQAAQLEATFQFLKYFAFGVSGRARDRRGAERDYTDLQGGGVLDFVPSQQVDVRLTVNAHRFLYYNRLAYSFYGPDATLNARYRFDRRHSISVFGNFNPRTYGAHALRGPNPDDPTEDPDTGVVRQDAVFGAGASYSYRGPFHFTFSYQYYDQTSNSFGETVKRHRLSATGGVRLPGKIMLLGTISWQPSIFPDGVYLNPDLSVVEDDENVSSVTVKLVRPLNQWIDLDLRYAGYLGFYPQQRYLYFRNVVSLGLAINF